MIATITIGVALVAEPAFAASGPKAGATLAQEGP
jgi:hypothetical protein